MLLLQPSNSTTSSIKALVRLGGATRVDLIIGGENSHLRGILLDFKCQWIKCLMYKISGLYTQCLKASELKVKRSAQNHVFSSFVENRSILDNVLVVSEILHHMKCKSKEKKKGEAALKINISKSYDREN